MAKAKAALEDQSVSVETLARPGLQHGIDQEGLMAAIAFTRSKLD